MHGRRHSSGCPTLPVAQQPFFGLSNSNHRRSSKWLGGKKWQPRLDQQKPHGPQDSKVGNRSRSVIFHPLGEMMWYVHCLSPLMKSSPRKSGNQLLPQITKHGQNNLDQLTWPNFLVFQSTNMAKPWPDFQRTFGLGWMHWKSWIREIRDRSTPAIVLPTLAAIVRKSTRTGI